MPPEADNGRDALAAFRRASEGTAPGAAAAGLFAYFDAACAAGEVAPLEADASTETVAPAQVRTLRSRLQRLGYAVVEPGGTPAGDWTAGLAAALREFQREAGLPDDGRPAVATWDRLRELFDFETPLRPEWCFVAGTARPALVRAVRLRLAVLGFPAGGAAEDGRRAWAAVLADLGVPVADGGAALTPELASRLFDHDALVALLAQAPGEPGEGLPKERRRAVEALAVCAAKIELWLLGYEVVPDGVPLLRRTERHGRPGHATIRLVETEASTALRRFFDDTELEGVMAFASERRLRAELPEFFRRTRQLRAREENLPREQASREIVAALAARLAERPGLWADLHAAGERMANLLFDGVRRAIAWVGRMLRGAARAVARLFEDTWLGNLCRVVWHFAGAVAFRLRKAARVFCSGVGFLFSANQGSEPAGQAWAAREGDFDLRCAIDTAAGPEVVGAWAGRLTTRARHFGLATRMIALAVGAVRRAALAAGAGPLGWVPLVLGLARIYSEARALGRELDAVPL